MRDLDSLINLIKDKMTKLDIPDYELLDKNELTSEDVGIKEYYYGITVVPCRWVLPYLEELQKLKGEH